MYGCDHVRCKRRFDELSSLPADPKIFSQQRLSSTRTQANEDFWFHTFEFSIEPRAASLNLRIARLLVNATLSAFRRSPFKVLYHIRDINFRAIDLCLGKRLIEQPAGWPNEWTTNSVLLVAGLFANQHDYSLRRAFAKNGLGRCFPQVASSTDGSFAAYL